MRRVVPAGHALLWTSGGGGKLMGIFVKMGGYGRLACVVTVLVLCLSSSQQHHTDGLKHSEQEEEAIERFRSYLQIDTSHPNPDYSKSTDFLLAQADLVGGLETTSIEFVKGKPVVLVSWKGEDSSLPSILLNSHVDVVPSEKQKWLHHPFSALRTEEGDIFARGSQDMKCVGMQYWEAVRNLKHRGFKPLRSVHLSFVPDEEIGGHDGAEKFVSSPEFKSLNVGFTLDEGLASTTENYRVFNGERSPWWLTIKAVGAPGHGSKLYDNSAIENLEKSLELIVKYRAEQFNLVKAGKAAEGDVVSVNPVFLKSGTPSPTGFVMNLQPSEAEAGFDIRVPPHANPEELERIISEEWAPASRNLTFKFQQKMPVRDRRGEIPITVLDNSNPWWLLFQVAVKKAGGKLGKPEIFPAATDSRYVRDEGIPALGFSPMANTPILLHDHNEFLNVKEYLKGIKVYEEIISHFASFSPEEPHQEF